MKAACEFLALVSPPFLFNYNLEKCCVIKKIYSEMPTSQPSGAILGVDSKRQLFVLTV